MFDCIVCKNTNLSINYDERLNYYDAFCMRCSMYYSVHSTRLWLWSEKAITDKIFSWSFSSKNDKTYLYDVDAKLIFELRNFHTYEQMLKKWKNMKAFI